ncbi:MAG: hypothetical protein HYT93_04370 [Parcubacteria group bacterium]|nr:hypothetical protein [Parcubacteria group bacterium]
MDTKKTIVTFIAIGVVLWIFWVAGADNSVTTALQKGLGLKDNVTLTANESGIQPVSLAGHPQLGNYLTDASGKTLYVTTKKDCVGECLVNWPPYVADKAVSQGDGLLGVVQNNDAQSLQYTWNGKLLYYYSQDKKPGDVFGHGVGGVWSLVQE